TLLLAVRRALALGGRLGGVLAFLVPFCGRRALGRLGALRVARLAVLAAALALATTAAAALLLPARALLARDLVHARDRPFRGGELALTHLLGRVQLRLALEARQFGGLFRRVEHPVLGALRLDDERFQALRRAQGGQAVDLHVPHRVVREE